MVVVTDVADVVDVAAGARVSTVVGMPPPGAVVPARTVDDVVTAPGRVVDVVELAPGAVVVELAPGTVVVEDDCVGGRGIVPGTAGGGRTAK